MGQFQFPPNTVLVSAVYAVSLSKPLLKRLKLEIQHCIDLTGRPDLAQYLKFAIAPVSTPSLSYHFSIVEGGEFSSNSGYGSIDRKEYCLVCILGICISYTGVYNTIIADHTKYIIIRHYEGKRVEDLVTFTAAKYLNAFLEYIEKQHSHAEMGQSVLFSFLPSSDYIELKLDHTPQKYPFNGWTIQSHFGPCRLYRFDIDKFGNSNYPIPSSCLVSVYGSPDAVPTLHYSVPLVGVVEPVTLYIHRTLRTVSANPTTFSSSSNVVHDSTSVSSTGGA
ncbi:PREDICTED: uncharacterized protein LOC109587584, partial [Amphimedon queenslandica]|uniref:Uncharacterized protein n=2 Tax=Amphimedon queenslandica TaxID=400682 RepID=A0AAN0JQS5_AMPQE